MSFFSSTAKAKKALKEVLLVGGPADACRMTVNSNQKQVKIIDDLNIPHLYNYTPIVVDDGMHIFFLHESLTKKSLVNFKA